MTVPQIEVSVSREAGKPASRTKRVSGDVLRVGSHESNDIVIEDPQVSRFHFQIRNHPGGWRLLDVGSLNGTRVGGVSVRDADLALPECTIVIGETTLRLRAISSGTEDRAGPPAFGALYGVAPPMRRMFERLDRIAKAPSDVLIEGESGTGKELVAAELVRRSARADKPFIIVDCGAISRSLVESELFGHAKGAFTGADRARPGAFESAEGGTVFLDEIGELPLEAQPKLLRALENRSFRRVGGAQVIKVNVRVVAATNRKLREMVRRKEFREDLFYRLAVVHVSVPRLADRPEDVLPLAEAFLRRATGDAQAKVSEELARLLRSYGWPGNARELRNVVERFATFDRADPKLLFEPGGAPSVLPGSNVFEGLEALPYHESKRRLMDRFHREVLPKVVERASGSVPKAAEILGLPRQSLYRMLGQLKDED